MDMYIKFSIIIFSLMIVNTMAFTVGFHLLDENGTLMSVSGVLAIISACLANCICFQLILAGKYQLNLLFYIGLIPTIGVLLAYLLFTKTDQIIAAISMFGLSTFISIVLLVLTFMNSNDKDGIVL